MSSRPSDASNDYIRELYSDHHGWLYVWLRKKLSNPADAADLAQDTFERILTRRDLATMREPRAFLRTIAHGMLANLLRHRKIEQTYLNALAAMPEQHMPSPETQALVVETLMRVDQLLNRLPRRTKLVFLMSQVDGMTQADIAQELGISIPTVRTDLLRAITHCSFPEQE